MQPTPEEIIKALVESGYLFEQEVASQIETNGYSIKTNSAFLDLDEGKSREMDVVAFKLIFRDEKLKISVGVRILCECKNSKSPFVFITRNKGTADHLYCPPNFIYPKQYYETVVKEIPKTIRQTNPFLYFDINSIFPYSKSDVKAVQFSKLVQKNKEWNAFHDGIYDSLLLPLSKCLEFHKKQDFYPNTEWKNFMIYFPLVVLSSTIFFVESHIDPSIVRKTDHITFTRAIKSKNQNETYLFDFVTLSGLDTYINEYVDVFAKGFVERVIDKESAK
jgi:hypothetical protein